MADSTTPCQGALWFASKGYSVLPLHSVTEAGGCTCGNSDCESVGKHPFAPLAPHGLKDATVDLDVIRGWFAEHYWLSYGIVTDALLVIDVDKKHGGLESWADMCGEPTRGLLHTWQVRTGGGGLHIMFENTPQIRSGKLDTGVDIRGVGGYIVGPCCPHRSGKRYEWLPQCSPKDTPLDVPPDWLPAIIRTRSHLGRPTSLQDWRKIAGTRLPNGERTTGLLRIMGHVISNSPTLDPGVLRELFLGWNRGMCDPPKADREVVEMVENLIVREHNKGKWF